MLELATAAGTICLGKTHQTEFAFSGLGINPNTATPPNKLLPGHCPGGSSSGAAASITHGLAPIAIGSDTGGSVRIPAAWNSLVGMKTTHGLLSLDNVVPLCPGFDTVGPLTKTVEDAALMIEIMGGGKTDLSARPRPSDLRFAIVETMALEDCDEAQLTAFEASVGALAKAGAKVERIKADEYHAIAQLGPHLFPYEAWHAWGELIEANPGKTYAPVEKRFLQGKSVTRGQYDAAWEELRRIRAGFFDRMAAFDGILSPTVPILPPRVDELLADEEKFTSVNLLVLRNTRFGNLLGSCALTLPTATRQQDCRSPAGLGTTAVFCRSARRLKISSEAPEHHSLDLTGLPAIYVSEIARSSPMIIRANRTSCRVTERAWREAIFGVACGSRTTRSAYLPGARLPVSPSVPSNLALPRVAE